MKGDYANSRIYRIVCNVTGKQYIGSTTQSLAKRLSTHKSNFRVWQQGKCNFITSFNIIENGDYDIVLVEELPDIKNVEQLRARERYHIEANECVNKVIPTRTMKEYYAANKEEIKAYKAKYCAEHKNEIKDYKAKYRADHKERIATQMVEYYAENKDKILAYQSERVTCEHCGSNVSRHSILRHQKSKKCLAAQAQN